jgi:hypothetical protein
MRIIDVVSPNLDKVDQYYFVGTQLFQVQEKKKFILVPMGGPTSKPPLKPG